MERYRGLIHSNLFIPLKCSSRTLLLEVLYLFSTRSISFARKNWIGHAVFCSYVPVHS